MHRSEHVIVDVDLDRVCRNAQEIARRTGVEVIPVVKADAYGLGAQRVVEALGPIVGRFCFFSIDEAVEAKLAATGKAGMTLGPPDIAAGEAFAALRVRPAVWTRQQARALAAARPILAVDTGMQRFACPAEDVAGVARDGACDEAFTHATRLEAVGRLRELAGQIPGIARLHAAGSSLLHEPAAWFDAVRPGLALYRGAVRVSARLIETRSSRGPVGYSGFTTAHHGVIRAGYSNGLRAGACLVNGVRRAIVEVGMQSSFVELGAADKAGDAVVLLGEELPLDAVAASWGCSPHETLVRLCGLGRRHYR